MFTRFCIFSVLSILALLVSTTNANPLNGIVPSGGICDDYCSAICEGRPYNNYMNCPLNVPTHCDCGSNTLLIVLIGVAAFFVIGRILAHCYFYSSCPPLAIFCCELPMDVIGSRSLGRGIMTADGGSVRFISARAIDGSALGPTVIIQSPPPSYDEATSTKQ